ncbi:efflux RND transporter periplasmic adaptor subunit [Pseudomonas matsuisoli]|uniref:Efflux RND transporter periplasmic adaptor subunit n=1 Tax=Pseudomonas matsuisoli TaxID=1515666 RepID=A0A917V0Y4_9PSED|nr:efflux RND transporter periplasmic adaptor subunit [Pseudomonas matsuisoli]GGK09096.1 hypothetical protein GCM10009304_39050 [Pseudomonas matsuisoli]
MNRKPIALFVAACALGLPFAAVYNSSSDAPETTLQQVLPLSTANAAESAPVAAETPAPAAGSVNGPAVAAPIDSPAGTAPAAADPAAPAAAANNERQTARGVVTAVHEATLSAGLASEITKMPFSEGQSFKKGDVLVEFNCERTKAESRAAEAAMQGEQKTVETNEELEKFNSIGKFDLLISVAKLNKAKAEYDALQAQMKQCKVTAPFAGRVTERMMRQYEFVQVGEPMLKIVDTGALELDLIIPSKWLQWLKPGSPFSFKVDETGQAFDGKVDRVLPSVDPVSKTMKIIGRFSGKSTGRTIPGMSGTATFTPEG